MKAIMEGAACRARGRWLGLLLGLGLSTTVSAGEATYLTGVTDITGERTYALRTRDEMEELEAQLRAEERWFDKAETLAAKEWSDTACSKGHRFPTSLSPRRIAGSPQEFRDREQAEKQLSRKQSEVAERKKERDNPTKLINRGGGRGRGVRLVQVLDKEEQARRKDRSAHLEAAQTLLTAKLSELIDASRGTGKNTDTDKTK